MSSFSYFWRGFWSFYLFFFLIVFPNFFGGGWHEEARTGTANTAFLVLGIGLFLWLILLWYLIKLTLFSSYFRKRKYRRLSEKGLGVLGIIHNRSVLKSSHTHEKLLLEIRFENLIGTRVGTTFTVQDKQPELLRYLQGKQVNLAIDPALKRPMVVLAEDVTLASPLGKLTILVLILLLIIGSIGMLLFNYHEYSDGYGWRFLRFYHPFFFEPILGLIVLSLLSYFLGSSRKTRLKLQAKAANAQIISYRQTGMYVNGQPMIAFELSFTDDKGIQQKSLVRKVIPLLDLSSLVGLKKMDILYNPANPKQIVLDMY